MGKSKGARLVVTIECACENTVNKDKKRKELSIFRYTTTKNRRNTPGRIELKKYCPTCHKHTTFKEIK